MKRYASIDFLRGLAIFIMLILHMIMHTLNVDALTADLTQRTFFELSLLVLLPFAGGMAGFFLMVSAMGNTVSMENELNRGCEPKMVAKRQVIGGFILLFFAMLVEGLIGYHGALGLSIHDALRVISNPALAPAKFNWDPALFRFNHFETIHTIAWCIIINGIVHARLAANKKYTDKNKMIRTYIKLIIIVLCLTPVMWGLAEIIRPGFPFGDGGYAATYPRIGTNSVWDFLIVFILEPIAGHPEPIFPYLAVSFMGTIFGLFLTMPKEQRRPAFIRSTNRIGMTMFLLGLAGVVINIVILINNSGLDSGLNAYMHIWDHRGWTKAIYGTPFLGWYFQFLFLNGFALCWVNSVIRLIEMRGKAAPFAKNTTFVRRFGFVAFTNYTMQYVYFIAMFVSLDLIFGGVYDRNAALWGPTILSIILGITFIHLLLLLWEKIRYAGSLEWAVKQINYFLNPIRRKSLKEKGIPWYKAGLLNVKSSFYEPKWVNIREETQIDHKHGEESRLAVRLARIGFIFPPYAITSCVIAHKAKKTEGDLKINTKARRLSIISTTLFAVLFICFLVVKLSMCV